MTSEIVAHTDEEPEDRGGPEDPAAFRFLGGRLCLDFVATLGKRRTVPTERLPDPAALSRWCRLAGLRGDGEPPLTAADLAGARELREALYRLVHAAMAGRSPEHADVEAVNAAAAHPDLVPRLSPDGAGVSLHRPAAGGGGAAALATVARDAVTLLGGPLAGRVKECQNPGCSLLFLDDSQARRRRWCSMDRCGNLAKIAGYRSRARRNTPHGPAARTT